MILQACRKLSIMQHTHSFIGQSVFEIFKSIIDLKKHRLLNSQTIKQVLMRNVIFILLLSLGMNTRGELIYIPTTSIVNPASSIASPADRLMDVDLATFKSMDRATFESITGQKMSIEQRIRFNRMKRKVDKNPSSFDSQILAQLAETDNRKIHWASIVAICCGGLAFLTGFFSIPAIIFGGIGLSKSGPGKEYKGRGLAIAGMVTGIVGVAIWLIAVAAL